MVVLKKIIQRVNQLILKVPIVNIEHTSYNFLFVHESYDFFVNQLDTNPNGLRGVLSN